MNDAMLAQTVSLQGYQGDTVPAYLATPLEGAPRGGVVVVHHLPGYDEATREITRRFAAEGYLAVCPNLHWRQAPDLGPREAFNKVRSEGGIPDEQLLGDVAAAADLLRAEENSNGKVGVIGFCSGGRQAVLAAMSMEFDAAVDCYGAWVSVAPPEDFPVQVTPLLDRAADLRCPLLGLFGADDERPSPEQTAMLADALEREGKTFEFTTYEGTGHAFFAVDMPSYRPNSATDGWAKILTWFGRFLTD